MQLRRGLVLFLWIFVSIIIIDLASAVEFNGTVYDTNGVPLNNSLLNVTVRSLQGWTIIGYNSTTANATGWFNLTLDDSNPLLMFQPFFKCR